MHDKLTEWSISQQTALLTVSPSPLQHSSTVLCITEVYLASSTGAILHSTDSGTYAYPTVNASSAVIVSFCTIADCFIIAQILSLLLIHLQLCLLCVVSHLFWVRCHAAYIISTLLNHCGFFLTLLWPSIWSTCYFREHMDCGRDLSRYWIHSDSYVQPYYRHCKH